MKFLIISFALFFVSPNTFASESGIAGHYKGLIVNTNAESKLPEKMTLGLVKQISGDGTLSFSGAVRLYANDQPITSEDYEELKLSQVSFNFTSQVLTLKTAHGLTFTLNVVANDILKGKVYSDSIAEAGKVLIGKF